MKISDFGTDPYKCSCPECKTTGPADKMWNVGGTSVVLCGMHAHEARKRGLRTFRLSQTIDFLEEKKLRENHFFESIGEMARIGKIGREKRKRHFVERIDEIARENNRDRQ